MTLRVTFKTQVTGSIWSRGDPENEILRGKELRLFREWREHVAWSAWPGARGLERVAEGKQVS